LRSNVSIIVITKNRKKELLKCINSIKKQTYKGKKECIIVDSSDAPVGSIKGVKYIYRKDANIPEARNIGIKNSNYDLIAYIDDDCVAHKNWLKESVNSIDNNAGVGGAVLSSKNNLISRILAYIGYPGGGIRWYYKYRGSKTKTDHICTCNSLFNKKILKKVKGFDEKLKYGGEDTNLSRRLKKKYSMLYNPQAIVYHDHRENIISIFKWSFRRGTIFVHQANKKIEFLLSPESPTLRLSFFLFLIAIFGIYAIPLIYVLVLIFFIKKLIDFKTPLKDIQAILLTPLILLVMVFAESFGNVYALIKKYF